MPKNEHVVTEGESAFRQRNLDVYVEIIRKLM